MYLARKNREAKKICGKPKKHREKPRKPEKKTSETCRKTKASDIQKSTGTTKAKQAETQGKKWGKKREDGARPENAGRRRVQESGE